jgi:hypothetical protein
VVSGAAACSEGRRPLLLVAEPIERGACVVLADRADHLWIEPVSWQRLETVRAGSPALASLLAREHARGVQPLISARALHQVERSVAGRAFVAELRAMCAFEPMSAGGFTGYRLCPPPRPAPPR